MWDALAELGEEGNEDYVVRSAFQIPAAAHALPFYTIFNRSATACTASSPVLLFKYGVLPPVLFFNRC